MRPGVIVAILAALAIPICSAAETSVRTVDDDAVAFVKRFYSWYVQEAKRLGSNKAVARAVQLKRAEIDSALATALTRDLEAQEAVPGEIVGIDYDPFLDCQDLAEGYGVGRAIKKGKTYLVDVHSIQSSTRSRTPDVVAEVAVSRGHWRIVNVHYPRSQHNLMEVLRVLSDRRDATTRNRSE